MNLGLGFFVWQLNRTVSSFTDEAALALALKTAGVQHVCLKVSDGNADFPGDPALEAQLERFIAAAKSAGIQVLGWGFAYGNSPQPYKQMTPEAEANKLVERVAALGLDGL